MKQNAFIYHTEESIIVSIPKNANIIMNAFEAREFAKLLIDETNELEKISKENIGRRFNCEVVNNHV